LTFAVNVVKFGLIIGMFPKPLKPCVVSSIRLPLSLKPALASFHEYYPTFLPKSNKKLNISDLWLKNDLRRWRSMEMTGMISRFVTPLYPGLVSHSMVDSQDDMLMWLMSEAKGVERSLEGVARRLLLVNFGAIHTTSLASDDIPSPSMMES
jgi:hypothetical protein